MRRLPGLTLQFGQPCETLVTRLVHPRAQPLDMTPVLAFGQHARDDLFTQFGGGEPAQQLHIDELPQPLRVRCDIPHTQAGRQRLGKPPDQNHAIEPVERGKTQWRAGMEIGIGIVLGHKEIVALGNAQHFVRHTR